MTCSTPGRPRSCAGCYRPAEGERGMGRGWLWRRRRQDWLTRDLDNAEFTLRLTRWLAARWSRHDFDVGSVLLDYTRRLTEAGRHSDALAALDEAITIGKRH